MTYDWSIDNELCTDGDIELKTQYQFVKSLQNGYREDKEVHHDIVSSIYGRGK